MAGLNPKKWGVVARVVGMVTKAERKSGTSAKTGKAYDMCRFSIGTGKEEFELGFGKDSQQLEATALSMDEGEEVAVDVRIGHRRDKPELLEMTVLSIKRLAGAEGEATDPTTPAEGAQPGGRLNKLLNRGAA